MATGDEQDLIEAVVTCEGNLHDPDFQDKFRKLVAKLKTALYISKTKDPFRVRKIEPWNSVRVTISIPKEAAQKLKLLAQQGSNVLRSMGILSVQVEGDQVISLTWAAQNNEATHVILRQTSDETASSSGTSGVSSSSLPASSPSISSISSSVASISSPVPLTPGPSGESSGMAVTLALDMLTSSPSTFAFRSPNVVAPSGEAIPVLPPKTPATGVRPALGGPFPFVSMTHAAQAIQRNEISPVLNSNNVVVSNSNISGSNAANSTNSIASSVPSSSLHQGTIKSVQPPQIHLPTTAISNNPPSSGAPVIVSTSTGNVVTTVNVSSESHVTRLVIENPSGLNSKTQMVGGNVSSLGICGNSNLAISQADPSQSLQLQFVNVPPPYPGVNTSSSNHSLSRSSSTPSGIIGSNVQVRHSQQQASLPSSVGGTNPTTSNLPTAITMISSVVESHALIERKPGGLLNEVPSVAPLTNISDSTSGSLAQPVSSPLLVNLLQNNDAPSSSPLPSTANADAYNQQAVQKNVAPQAVAGSSENPPGRFLIQQQVKKTKRGLSMDGACPAVPKPIPDPISGATSGPDTALPATVSQTAGATESFQFALPLPSDNTTSVTMNRVNIPPSAHHNKAGGPLPGQKTGEQSSTAAILHGRTIVQGNIRILDPGSGQLRTIPLSQQQQQQHPPPPPYSPTSIPQHGKAVLPHGQLSAGSEHLSALTNGPLLASSLSQSTDDSKPQTTAPITLVQSDEHRTMDRGDSSKTTLTSSLAADQSRTLLPITTVNIVSKSTSKPSSTVNVNNCKDTDTKTFIPPPDPRLSSQVQKISQGGSNPVSMKNSASSLVVQTANYNIDAKSSTSQPNSAGRAVMGNKRPHKDRPFPLTGKPRQFLINPLTGLLEPMPSESSSESEEGDDGEGEGGRKSNSHKASSHKNKAGRGAIPTGVHHRQIVTTETGVTVARVVKASSLSLDPVAAQSHKESEGRRSSNDSGFVPSVMSVTKKSRDDSVTNAALYNPKDAKDTASPSPATLTATSVSGEKIKLRLKLEKSEPISPAYKVDVSFVKKSEKSSMLPSSNISSGSSGSGLSSASTFSSSGSQFSSVDQPRVPPLHISLRGKNAAVVVSPRREEKEMPPPLSIVGNTKDPLVTVNAKDVNASDIPSTSSMLPSLSSKSQLNSHEIKSSSSSSKSKGNTKRAKSRVKSLDGNSGSKELTIDKVKAKTSRPKLSKEGSRQGAGEISGPTQNVQFSMPVLQPAIVLPATTTKDTLNKVEDAPPSVVVSDSDTNTLPVAQLLPSDNNNKCQDQEVPAIAEKLPLESSNLPSSAPDLIAEHKNRRESGGEQTVVNSAAIENQMDKKEIETVTVPPLTPNISSSLPSQSESTLNQLEKSDVTIEQNRPTEQEDVLKGALDCATGQDKPIIHSVALEDSVAPQNIEESSQTIKNESFIHPVIDPSAVSCDNNTADIENGSQNVDIQDAKESVDTDISEISLEVNMEIETTPTGATPSTNIEQKETKVFSTENVIVSGQETEEIENPSVSPSTIVMDETGGKVDISEGTTKEESMQEESAQITEPLKVTNTESKEEDKVLSLSLENEIKGATSPVTVMVENPDVNLDVKSILLDDLSATTSTNSGIQKADEYNEAECPITTKEVEEEVQEAIIPSDIATKLEDPVCTTSQHVQEECPEKSLEDSSVPEKVSQEELVVKEMDVDEVIDVQQELKPEEIEDQSVLATVSESTTELASYDCPNVEKVTPSDPESTHPVRPYGESVECAPLESEEPATGNTETVPDVEAEAQDVAVEIPLGEAEVLDKKDEMPSPTKSVVVASPESLNLAESVAPDERSNVADKFPSDCPQDSSDERQAENDVEETIQLDLGNDKSDDKQSSKEEEVEEIEPRIAVNKSIQEKNADVELESDLGCESELSEEIERGSTPEKLADVIIASVESVNTEENLKLIDAIPEHQESVDQKATEEEVLEDGSKGDTSSRDSETVEQFDEEEKKETVEPEEKVEAVEEESSSTVLVTEEGAPSVTSEVDDSQEKVLLDESTDEDSEKEESSDSTVEVYPTAVTVESVVESKSETTKDVSYTPQKPDGIVDAKFPTGAPTTSSSVKVNVASSVPKLQHQLSEKKRPAVHDEKLGHVGENTKIKASGHGTAIGVTIITPKRTEVPTAATTDVPPISIVLPSESMLKSSNPEGKSGTSKNAYKRRAEIKPGALQNTLKRLHDNFLPKVLKTSDNQDVTSQRTVDTDGIDEPPVTIVEPVKAATPPLPSPIPKVSVPFVAVTQTQPVSIAVSPVRPLPNIIHRPKISASAVPITASAPQPALHQIQTGLQKNLLANVSTGLTSSTITSVASLSVPSTSSGSAPQTVFAIHPNVSIPANFAQLQQSPVVLQGSRKIVPIKVVTFPKQSGGQLQTLSLGNATPNRSSPNLLEAVNIVANAGSRSSSPKTTLISNAMQSTPLNLSSMSLPVGGNLHFVPISVSSATGTSGNVKVLMTQPIKMQQAGLSQSMVVKSVLMGGNQPTTIRVIHPSGLQEPIAIQTLIKPATEQQDSVSNEVSRQSQKKQLPDVIVGDTSKLKKEFTLQTESLSLFKKLDGVEIVETGSPLNNDELPFEADIIHDEKDLADVLAAEAKNEIISVENCSSYNITIRPDPVKTAVKGAKIAMSTPLTVLPSSTQTVPNHVGPKGLIHISRDTDVKSKEGTSTSKTKSASPYLTYSGVSKPSLNRNSTSRSPSPLNQNAQDLHGEDQEIIDSFSGSDSLPHLTSHTKSLGKEPIEGKVITGTELLPDHTYGLTSAINRTNCSSISNVDEVLSIEIPPIDIEVAAALSPSQHVAEERRCTRSTRSNTRLSPDITAFVSDTPKPSKLSGKVDPLILRNSPKPSPTGSLKVLSPTPSSLTITPSTSTRSSPILHSQHQANASNAAATINAVALGIIDKIQGNAMQNVKNSRVSKLTGANKRKRQESDSSSASRDENNEEKAEIDLNSRPGKRKCSENAAEMIKVCIGVEDSPKRNSTSIKKTDEIKLKESKTKKGMAPVAEEDDDVDSEVSLSRGRSGRSSRESSEDRSSSRGSSVQRVVSSVTEKPKIAKEEEQSKDAKPSRLNSRLNKDGRPKTKISSQLSSTPAKKVKESEKIIARRPNRPNSKKSPLTPAKTRTNVRKDAVASNAHSDKGTSSTPSTNSNPENENARRKTRSSAASKRHAT